MMRILALVGPKGCGKTFVGRMVESELANATFLNVEQIAIDFLKESGGSAASFNDPSFRASFFHRILQKVEGLVTTSPGGEDGIIVFETTGAAPETKAFLGDLKRFGPVYLVRIRASTTTCAERIRGRDASKQVDVSTEMIERLHAATEALDWEWDLELANDTSVMSNETILGDIAALLGVALTKVYQDDVPAKSLEKA